MTMYITLAILVIASAFFMMGKIRSDLVALSSLLLLVLFGILSPEEALSGFSNSVVVMMIGLFVVGGAIFQTGLAKMISNKLLKLAGKSELKLFVLVILATSFIGAFVSNTGTVALMLPIVVSMAMSANINSSRLLMPLAFASSLGGMMTLIGTPPNLIINEELIKHGFPSLTFFSFTPVGLVALAVGLLYLIPVSKCFLNKADPHQESKEDGKSLSDLMDEYQLSKDIHLVMVGKNAPFVGKTLLESHIADKYEVHVTEILRKPSLNSSIFQNLNRELAQANTILHEGDILFVQGDIRKIEAMAKRISPSWRIPLCTRRYSQDRGHGLGEVLEPDRRQIYLSRGAYELPKAWDCRGTDYLRLTSGESAYQKIKVQRAILAQYLGYAAQRNLYPEKPERPTYPFGRYPLGTRFLEGHRKAQ